MARGRYLVNLISELCLGAPWYFGSTVSDLACEQAPSEDGEIIWLAKRADEHETEEFGELVSQATSDQNTNMTRTTSTNVPRHT